MTVYDEIEESSLEDMVAYKSSESLQISAIHILHPTSTLLASSVYLTGSSLPLLNCTYLICLFFCYIHVYICLFFLFSFPPALAKPTDIIICYSWNLVALGLFLIIFSVWYNECSMLSLK